MIGDTFVFNSVAHAYNLTDENTVENNYALSLRAQLCSLHTDWQPGYGLSVEEQHTDWPIELLARTLFLETDCDMAATHTLRLDSYFRDGLCARAKTVEAVRRWPNRFVGYVGVDPTAGLDACLRDLDEQLDEMPEAVGLKLYPAQVNPLRSWRMDDDTLASPLFERARARGVKTVAIHKASPLGPVPLDPFRIGDIDLAADRFPDMSFEIVHAGVAFLEETALAISRYPNVYANLEVTSAMILQAPGVFEQILATFMNWAGPKKILFSDGNMVFHSQPILEAFAKFQFSEFTLAATGGRQITDLDKAAILGGNYARILGVNVDAAKAKISTDEFSQERAETGRQPLYSNWRKHLAQQ